MTRPESITNLIPKEGTVIANLHAPIEITVEHPSGINTDYVAISMVNLSQANPQPIEGKMFVRKLDGEKRTKVLVRFAPKRLDRFQKYEVLFKTLTLDGTPIDYIFRFGTR